MPPATPPRMASPGAPAIWDRLETACSPAPPCGRAAGAGAGGGVRAAPSAAAVSLARLESLSSASTGVAPPAWPYVEPPTGGACANRIVRTERLALDRPDGVQVVAKRHRRARSDAQLDAVPVLARGVVDDRPPLHVHLAGLVHHQPVARLPGRRLGDVGELQPVRRGARKADLHVDERLAPLARARGRIGDGRGLTGVGVDHRQRAQKVIDPLGGDGELQGIAFDRSRAFEVGDAVSVDHDPPEHRVGGADIAGSGPHIRFRRARARRRLSMLLVSCRLLCRIPVSDETHVR